MALGSGLAGVARVAFEANTGPFYRDLREIETRWKQTLARMEAEARRFSAANKLGLAGAGARAAAGAGAAGPARSSGLGRLEVAAAGGLAGGAGSSVTHASSAVLAGEQLGWRQVEGVAVAGLNSPPEIVHPRSLAARTEPAVDTGRAVHETGQLRQAQAAAGHQSDKTSQAQERLNHAVGAYGPGSRQATRETRNLERAQRELQHSTDGTQRSLGQSGRGVLQGTGLFRGFGRSVAYASAAFIGGAGLTFAIRASITAASDLHEEMTKSQVVFGSAAKAVQDWSATGAVAMGVSRVEALRAAGAFGNMFRTIGQTGAQSAAMSTKLAQLGVDMASFNNADPAEMLSKLQSGLAGIAKPLRTYGVFMNENTVKQLAWSTGIAKNGADLTEAQKVLARYALIMRDTAIQQGDFARTSGGLANQQRILHAQVQNLEQALGEALLPTVLTLTKHLTKWLGNTENQRRVQHDLEQTVRVTVGTLKALFDVVRTVSDALGGATQALKILLALFVVSKVVAFTTALYGLAGAETAVGASALGAAGSAKLLLTRLSAMAAIGAITIPIILLTSEQKGTAARNATSAGTLVGAVAGFGIAGPAGAAVGAMLGAYLGHEFGKALDEVNPKQIETKALAHLQTLKVPKKGRDIWKAAFLKAIYEDESGSQAAAAADTALEKAAAADLANGDKGGKGAAGAAGAGAGGHPAADPDTIETLALPGSLTRKEAQARRSGSESRIRAALREQRAFYAWALRTKKLSDAAYAGAVNSLLAIDNETQGFDDKAQTAKTARGAAAAARRAHSFDLPDWLATGQKAAARTPGDVDDKRNWQAQKRWYEGQLRRKKLTLAEKGALYDGLGAVESSLADLEANRTAAQQATDSAAADARAKSLLLPDKLALGAARAARTTKTDQDDKLNWEDQRRFYLGQLRRKQLTLAEKIPLVDALSAVETSLAGLETTRATTKAQKRADSFLLPERLQTGAAHAALTTKSDADDRSNWEAQRRFWLAQLQRKKLTLQERRVIYEALGSVNSSLAALEANRKDVREAARAAKLEREDLLVENAKARAGLTVGSADDISALRLEERLVNKRLARLQAKVKLSNDELTQQNTLLTRLARIRDDLKKGRLASDAFSFEDEAKAALESFKAYGSNIGALLSAQDVRGTVAGLASGAFSAQMLGELRLQTRALTAPRQPSPIDVAFVGARNGIGP